MKLSEFRQNLSSEKRYFLDSQETGNRLKDLEMILDVVKNINSSLILEDVLALVLTHAIEITDSERGFIVLKNQKGDLEYRLGLDSKGLKLPEHFFNISTSVVADVFHSGHSKFVEGAQTDKDYNPSKSILNLALQTILCSPLITKGKKIGVIYVDSKYLKKINSREITYTFEILAGQAAAAINNAQLYQELHEAKDSVERSDKLKTEFLAQMSHEIRTPINAILSSTSLIKESLEETNDKDLLSFFEISEAASKRIIRTVDLVLNMSQLQTGNYEAILKIFDINWRVLQVLFEQFKVSASQKGLEFTLKLLTENTTIVGDEYSINQIFLHLIDNALKFTEKGKVEIIIGRDDKERLYAKVTDTGVGINKQYMPHLFEAFTQEEQGYTRHFEGNGLGLSLVKKYCELNKAEVSVESVKGKGTTVTVIFPN